MRIIDLLERDEYSQGAGNDFPKVEVWPNIISALECDNEIGVSCVQQQQLQQQQKQQDKTWRNDNRVVSDQQQQPEQLVKARKRVGSDISDDQQEQQQYAMTWNSFHGSVPEQQQDKAWKKSCTPESDHLHLAQNDTSRKQKNKIYEPEVKEQSFTSSSGSSGVGDAIKNYVDIFRSLPAGITDVSSFFKEREFISIIF